MPDKAKTPITTWEDCEKAAKTTGLNADTIAHAFGVDSPDEITSFKGVTTQDDRRDRLKTTPEGSKFALFILEEILRCATTQDERWRVFRAAPIMTDVWKKAFSAILKGATYTISKRTNFKEIEALWREAPHGSLEENLLFREIFNDPDLNKDHLHWIICATSTGSDIWKEAVRGYVLLTFSD